jgi:predicted nucleic acid-binding protein
MVLFDTSIIVDAARGKKAALDIIESYSKNEKIATTVVTKYELLRGVADRDLAFVSELLEKFLIFDFCDKDVQEVVEAYKIFAGKRETS